ncbi:CPBP family glutamic-type intramembrane protease [Engelhardtia mirabilis]|uniref:CAAX amino terminal protease self-immunity n=1 Tax=Engelhardtia mirabilis TaxID=2528011 RepID=A0A518BJ92_9BACT|nr:CAAX amino terminal protease self- immunity [Planctomycetes bacterium Pla133]QDV01376.1 CAAX amino terminal protease self- immunity [Planctomycetes bacterium Pla86]
MTPLFSVLADDDEFEEEYDERPSASIALGLLATVPLLLCYEAAVGTAGSRSRNIAEVVLSAPFTILAPHEHLLRVLLWMAVAVAAAVAAHRRLGHLGPPLMRVGVEGAIGALVLGPALILAASLFGTAAPALPLNEWYPDRAPDLAAVGFLAGGGAYEELVFRLGGFSLVFLVVRHLISFFGAPLVAARWVAEVAATVGSAVLFAAFHFELATRWLGWRGDAFDAGRFFWYVLAGLLLCALFRWRGLGVAAWTHGLFNAAMILGAGPGVLRGH